jgi:zinc finger FYVE domain-containing protein 26
MLPNLRNLKSFHYIVDFLEKNCDPQIIVLQKYQMSSKIYEELNKVDEQLWKLAKYPLLLIEQLLMNLRIEVTAKVIRKIRPLLKTENPIGNCENCSRIFHQNFNNFSAHKISSESANYNMNAKHENSIIKTDCIDLLLRVYASKALDFKIVEGAQSLSSLDIGSLDSLAGIFQMPKEIPNKAKWVPDSEAKSCMVCKKTSFTLLNRRHHCR